MHAKLTAPTERWDVQVEARPGVVVPTLSPLEAADAPSTPGGPAAMLAGVPAEREPFPGVVAWLWRMLTGRPFGPSIDLKILRAQFRSITPASHHPLARTLTQGELAACVVRWSQAQIRWCGRVAEQARRELDAQLGPIERDLARPAPTAPATQEPTQAVRPRPGSTLVMPGGQRVGVPFKPELFESMFAPVQGGTRLDGTPAGTPRKAGA